jgi:hypothetical protein
MKLYAIIDEESNIARHIGNGKLAVFKDLKQLKQHAWRYTRSNEKYKILEFESGEVRDFEEEE